MNVYSGLKDTHSNRHQDGWQVVYTGEETGKKVGKKLKLNADVIDPDEAGQDDASLDLPSSEDE